MISLEDPIPYSARDRGGLHTEGVACTLWLGPQSQYGSSASSLTPADMC